MSFSRGFNIPPRGGMFKMTTFLSCSHPQGKRYEISWFRILGAAAHGVSIGIDIGGGVGIGIFCF
jgi:hypothetical protein